MLTGYAIHRIKAFSIAVLSIVAFAGAAQAQPDLYGRWENGVSEPWWFTKQIASPEEIAAVQARWKTINDENKSESANGWAGDYFVGGDTHGIFLRWSTQSGFVLMNVDKCAAHVMGFSYGKVIATPTLIQFFTEKAAVEPGSHGHGHAPQMLQRFLPVTWRGELYLVSENEIDDFGDYIAGLGKFNNGVMGHLVDGLPFFIKAGTRESGSVDEAPVVPPGFERFIKKPLDARITWVGKRVVKERRSEYMDAQHYESETPVAINLGRADGVKPGMSFFVLTSDGDAFTDSVEIRNVADRSSTGVIVRWLKETPNVDPFKWKDNNDLKYQPIRVGWEVTTSIHKLRDHTSTN